MTDPWTSEVPWSRLLSAFPLRSSGDLMPWDVVWDQSWDSEEGCKYPIFLLKVVVVGPMLITCCQTNARGGNLELDVVHLSVLASGSLLNMQQASALKHNKQLQILDQVSWKKIGGKGKDVWIFCAIIWSSVKNSDLLNNDWNLSPTLS